MDYSPGMQLDSRTLPTDQAQVEQQPQGTAEPRQLRNASLEIFLKS